VDDLRSFLVERGEGHVDNLRPSSWYIRAGQVKRSLCLTLINHCGKLIGYPFLERPWLGKR